MVEVAVGIESGELAPGSGMKGQWLVEWLVFVIGFATACMAAAVAMYKAPVGIFDDHELTYYVSVVSAGVVGLAEAFAAVIWMSGSGGPNLHARGRRCVLCVSFLPLVFVAGLGGVSYPCQGDEYHVTTGEGKVISSLGYYKHPVMKYLLVLVSMHERLALEEME